MSIPRRVDAGCKNCGATFQVTIWESINTDMGLDLPKRLMSGEFFNITCPNCGETAHIEYPMLYNDLRHSAFIQLAPTEEMRKSEEEVFETFRSFGIDTMRIVKNGRELAEKVTCLEYGRDDRLVEICKAYCKGALEEEKPDFVPDRGYYYHNGDNEFIVFFDAEDNSLTCRFPEEVYDGFAQHLHDFLEKDATNQSFVVDEEWLESFIEENQDSFPV